MIRSGARRRWRDALLALAVLRLTEGPGERPTPMRDPARRATSGPDLFRLAQLAVIASPLFVAVNAFNHLAVGSADAVGRELLVASALILIQTVVATSVGTRICDWDEGVLDLIFPLVKAAAIIEMFVLLEKSPENDQWWPLALSFFAVATIGHLFYVKWRGRLSAPKYVKDLNADIVALVVLGVGGILWHFHWEWLASHGWEAVVPPIVIAAACIALGRQALYARRYLPRAVSRGS